jgi:hypothetical protein
MSDFLFDINCPYPLKYLLSHNMSKITAVLDLIIHVTCIGKGFKPFHSKIPDLCKKFSILDKQAFGG